MRTEGYESVTVEVQGETAIATLQGEEGGNRYSMHAMYAEFGQLACELRDDPAMRTLVITATGPDDVFSLGQKPQATYPESVTADLSQNTSRRGIREFFDLGKPVITALNGPITGGIMAMVLAASDFIVAEEHAALRDIHVPLGVPSTTGPLFWPMSVGLMKARRYVLTGEWISAQEAERIGLVTEVVPKGTSLERSLEYANLLNSMSPSAVGGTKRNLNQWLRVAFPSIFDPGLVVQFVDMLDPKQGYESQMWVEQEETMKRLQETGSLF